MTPLAAYTLWAATYDETPNPLLALEERITEPLVPLVWGRTVVDIGCGTGRWARIMAARGARVIAVDACEAMLARAPRPAILGDASRIPLADSVADVAICAFVFSYTGPRLDELARITRPGGTVIGSDMHPLAVRRGWTRSFRTAAGPALIASTSYSLDALRSPLLDGPELIEAQFGEPERELFVRAGKADAFNAAAALPAIFVARWVRRAD
jgi:SAM-dependent methyltransferase